MNDLPYTSATLHPRKEPLVPIG